MERSGQTLKRVSNVFFGLTGANTNDELQKIEEKYRLFWLHTAMPSTLTTNFSNA